MQNINNISATQSSLSQHSDRGEHVVALLLAGGVGSRFSSMRPKQYIEVDGMPIIGYTMQRFECHPEIDDIYVVNMPQWDNYIAETAQSNAISKFRGSLPSGQTSFESIRKGVEGLVEMGLPENTIVLVHDAVRPLVKEDTISENIDVCRHHGNAITVIYSNEAYMHVNGTLAGDGYASREEYMRAQTPHTFTLAALKEMLKAAKERGAETSQSLFTLANELGGITLYMAQGNILNFKITKPQDLQIFKALMHLV